MTIEGFIRSLLPLLPHRKAEALEEIEGALTFDGMGQTFSPEDRQRLIVARVEIQAGRTPVP